MHYASKQSLKSHCRSLRRP